MGAISATGTVTTRPGAIISPIPTGTGVLITGPTGSTITGRTITQPADITIRDEITDRTITQPADITNRDDITVGIAHAVITNATAIVDTGAPGTVTIGTGTGLTAVITGATIVSCQAV